MVLKRDENRKVTSVLLSDTPSEHRIGGENLLVGNIIGRMSVSSLPTGSTPL